MATRDGIKAAEPVDLGKFPNGLNNVSPDTDLPEGALVSAINVDIDKEGNIRSRKGYTEVYSGEGIHSLFDSYFVEGTDLKYFDGTSATTIESNLDITRYLVWENVFDDYYYSDGYVNKIAGKGPLGLPTPPNNPTLTEVTGKLSAGTYQVAVCYTDPDSGEISGALLANTISVQDNAGILCSDIPDSPDGYDVIVYVSTQNGEQLYQNGIVSNGFTNYTILDSKKSTRTLDTQFLEPLPGGHIITHFKARIYVADDNVLWYSEAFRMGLHKPSTNFFQFPSRITIVQAVDDGIYVVADKTYWLAGADPKAMQQVVVSKHTGIEGTGLKMGGESFGTDSTPYQGLYVGFWYSNTGAVLGKAKGEMVELTDDRLAIPTGVTTGSSMYRKFDGIKQVVTNFNNGGTASTFKFGAQATSAIYRNGVLIP